MKVKNMAVERLPEDMRDRVYMMDVNKDGSVTLYFAVEDNE